jgi:enoyl-CoA hydratase/carnithine racemase
LSAPGSIRTERRGAVLIITIDRIHRKNAITAELYSALRDAVIEAQRDSDVGCLLVTGAGGEFTAGNDLDDFIANPPDHGDAPVFQFMHAVVDCDKPLVAAVDGVAVGIGTTLLLHCDFVLATPRARFKLPFVDLGVVPEFGSTLLLPGLVGYARAAELLLLCDTFDAQTAERLGLVNRIVASEDLAQQALAVAERLASKPSSSVRDTRRLMRAGLRERLHEAIGSEGRRVAEGLQSPAFAAALSALKKQR